MFRRAALAVATAAALLILPSTALAATYPPEATSVTVSDASPTAGESFTVQIAGPAGKTAVLQIAGVKEWSATIPANGVATFTVTLDVAGTYTLTALVDGQVVDTLTVTVQGAGETLSETGSNALPLILGAGGLVLAGGAGVLVARRRRAEAGA